MAETLAGQAQAAETGVKPDTHFVYWYHAPYNVENVLPELDSADVLLLESPVSWSRADKDAHEAWLNNKLGAELTDEQRSLLNVVPFGNQSIPPLNLAIAERFAASGKTARLLDANSQEHPAVARRAESRFEIAHGFNKDLGTGLPPGVQELVRAQREAFTAQAVSSSERDDIISEQIDVVRQEFAGQQFAVVYGSGHTQLSYSALRASYGRRTFVDGTGSGVGLDGTTIKYNLATEIVRRVQFGLPVSEEQLVRSLLQSSLTAYLAQARGQDATLAEYNIEQWEYDTADLTPRSDEIARRASDEDIQRYTQLIEDVSWVNGGDIALYNFVGELTVSR